MITRRELQGRVDEQVVRAFREIYDFLDKLGGQIDDVQKQVKTSSDSRGTTSTADLSLNVTAYSIINITAGVGTPEGNVSGNIGDLYVRQVDGGAATTFYVKESGQGTRTGWAAK